MKRRSAAPIARRPRRPAGSRSRVSHPRVTVDYVRRGTRAAKLLCIQSLHRLKRCGCACNGTSSRVSGAGRCHVGQSNTAVMRVSRVHHGTTVTAAL